MATAFPGIECNKIISNIAIIIIVIIITIITVLEYHNSSVLSITLL